LNFELRTLNFELLKRTSNFFFKDRCSKLLVYSYFC